MRGVDHPQFQACSARQIQDGVRTHQLHIDSDVNHHVTLRDYSNPLQGPHTPLRLADAKASGSSR